MPKFAANLTMMFLPALVIATAALLMNEAAAADKRYSGPLIDAHGHIGGSFDPEVMERVTFTNGVRAMTLMARYYPGLADDQAGDDDMSLEMAAKYPGRFFPLVGMQRPMLTGRHKWLEPDYAVQDLLENTEKKLASGKFYGIGEVIVRHFAYSKGKHAELDQPIYSAFTQALSRLGQKYDVPVVIHMEGDPALVKDFERLIDENPKTVYVWAHNCGRSRAPVIRRMLTGHPNLMCDLGGMTNTAKQNYGTGRPRMESYTSLMEKDGHFLPEMHAIYEDFSDRFVIGMDVAHAIGMNEKNYGRRVFRFRVLLGRLKPKTAKKLAETNATRIFHLDR
jgi:hypothetical protein